MARTNTIYPFQKPDSKQNQETKTFKALVVVYLQDFIFLSSQKLLLSTQESTEKLRFEMVREPVQSLSYDQGHKAS